MIFGRKEGRKDTCFCYDRETKIPTHKFWLRFSFSKVTASQKEKEELLPFL